jgi:hypothetical protein
VLANLEDSADGRYALVLATMADLRATRRPFRVLDAAASAEDYVLATEMRPGAKTAAAGLFSIVQDDGRRWVVRATAREAEQLAELGFALQRLGLGTVAGTPPPPAFGRGPIQFDPQPPHPLIIPMLPSVQATNLHWLIRRLSGEEATVAGGVPCVISNRNTALNTTLRKATELVFERLQALGLDPQYHQWSASGYTNRNVVGTLPGGARSNELVLLVAHLDDMPQGARAPGADDNASGSAAVLTAAGVLRQCAFERTLRFVLFTGEE